MTLPAVSHQKFKWIALKKPTEEDIEWLAKNFSFHPLELEESLSLVQRPRIDSYTNYVSLVLQFPAFEDGKMIASELNAFLGEDYLVTIHNERLDLVDNLFNKCLRSEKEAAYHLKLGPASLLYTLVDQLVDSCTPLLEKMGKNIEMIDRQLFQASAKDVVEKISLIRRNAIVFQTMIKPQLAIFGDLEKGDRKLLDHNLKIYWGMINDHLHKAWDRLEDYRELIEGLAATNESLISFRTNEIIKVLAIFSVVLLPSSLLAGIYGMNLKYMPFAKSPFAIVIIAATMLSIFTLMLAFFRKKGWI